MNGECKTYELNKPVKYEVFKNWPIDIQAQYITRLRNEFNATDIKIGEMMGCSGNTIAVRRRFCKIPPLGKNARTDISKFNAWINGDSKEVEVEELDVNTQSDICESEAPAGLKVSKMQFSLTADDWTNVLTFIRGIDISSGARISIEIDTMELTQNMQSL